MYVLLNYCSCPHQSFPIPCQGPRLNCANYNTSAVQLLYYSWLGRHEELEQLYMTMISYLYRNY